MAKQSDIIVALECVHRGAQIGEHTCECCGLRGKVVNVYQCNLLNKPCIWRWWTNVKTKRDQSGEVACITCRDRTLQDGTKPWELRDAAAQPQQCNQKCRCCGHQNTNLCEPPEWMI